MRPRGGMVGRGGCRKEGQKIKVKRDVKNKTRKRKETIVDIPIYQV
jgi:hypothetical protein